MSGRDQRRSLTRAVLAAVWKRGHRSPFGIRVFGGARSYVGPKKRVEVIGFETVSGAPMLFWFGQVPVLVRHTNHSNGEAGNYNSEMGLVTMWFLRGTLDVDAFVEEAITRFNQLSASTKDQEGKTRKRFNVYRISRRPQSEDSGSRNAKESQDRALAPASSGSDDILRKLQHNEVRLITWKPEDLIERTNDQPPFDLYPFGENPLSILPEVERWLQYENWFRQKGVPWRRGYLCHGPGGTGKSTFVRSIAIKHDLPLYSFDLASLDNQSFTSEWRQVQQNTPAVVLLEDLDCVFSGREFVASTSKQRDTLTFDCLLNTISGVGSSDGILLFVTTNRVETLDPALGIPMNGDNRSTRPGRLDKTLYFGPMEEPQRCKLAQFILSDYPTLVEETVSAGEGESAAQFQDRCAQIALGRFWTDGVPIPANKPPEAPLFPPFDEDMSIADSVRWRERYGDASWATASASLAPKREIGA